MKTTPLAQTAPTFFSPPPHAHACVLPPARRRAAFTLVELLVVIGVIAVLIGILLPVLGKARKAGTAAVCMSNMRGLGQATNAYMVDNQRYLPQPTQASASTGLSATESGSALWYNALDYYLGQEHKNYSRSSTTQRNYEEFKQDPVWKELDETIADPTGRTRRNTQTIKMNEFLSYSDAGNKFLKATDPLLANPSQIVAYVDGQGHDTPSVTTGNTANATSFSASPGLVGLRHEGGANLTYLDGHAGHEVNEVSQSGAGYRAWYSESTANQSNWPESIFNFRLRDR